MPPPRPDAGGNQSTEKRLLALEHLARARYTENARHLDLPQPEGAMKAFLDERIMPVLSKIGFDDAFVHVLFGLAADAWGSLMALPAHIVALYPGFRHQLADVREGLLIQSEKKMAADPGPAVMTPELFYDIVKRTMAPDNLHLAIEEVKTPWIILPRASASLQRGHAHCLPAYLEMIDKETNEEALHIFTRIAVEFLASYTINFADERHPKQQVARLVIDGYSAMFWQNLNAPPMGFEDVRVFEHFLTWLRFSGVQWAEYAPDVHTTIQTMASVKADIFPTGTGLTGDGNGRSDPTRFLVALRHGCLGIACSVRHFWLTPGAAGGVQPSGKAWETVLFAFKSFLDLLAGRYAGESRRTRYFIHEFLFQLKNTYEHFFWAGPAAVKSHPIRPQFMQAKMTAMILKLQHILKHADIS